MLSVASFSFGISGRTGSVRWRIFWLLLVLTIAVFVQRTSVSVAGARMMPDLGLSQVQLGWLETAFLASYAFLQFPGALAGEKIGSRRMIALCGLLGVGACLAMPIAPAFLAGAPLFLVLLAAQFTLGVSQAPFFAMLTGTLERWFPARDWALTQGLSSAGIGLGSALTPPLIASLMVIAGWRVALILAALPVVVLVVWWWWDARDEPRLHPAMTPAELAAIGPRPVEGPPRIVDGLRLMADRNVVLLTLAYLAMNVAFYLISFWSFLYLVQARKFTLLAGGLAAAAPPIAGAVGAALGGVAVGACMARFGPVRGLRIVPLLSLPVAGALLWAAVRVDQAWLALVALTLAFGALELNEAAFWTAAMVIGRRQSAAAGGVLNTGGNLGGILATPVVAWLSSHGGWTLSFEAGAVCAVASGLAWFAIAPGAAAPERALNR